ncbi:MAG: putative endonuclease/exonuclease/phosphatase family protein, partial [Polaromonas sp.]|nr:putative endonuclease/exonuclease/phosphatase family protein [Polaromonas sp.]
MKKNLNSKFLGASGLAGRVALSLLVISLQACGGSHGDAPMAAVPPPVAAPLPACTTAIPATAPLTAISAVQGDGHLSPLAAQNVTVRGVVVGEFQNTASAGTASTRLNGF